MAKSMNWALDPRTPKRNPVAAAAPAAKPAKRNQPKQKVEE